MKTRNRAGGLTVILISATSLALSCAGPSRSRHTLDDTGSHYESNVPLHADPNEAKMATGRRARAEGDFDAALWAFLEVYMNHEAKPELRAEALYQMGLAHGDLLNPRKDYNQAIAQFKALIHEFPDSPLRPKAEAEIERIRQFK